MAGLGAALAPLGDVDSGAAVDTRVETLDAGFKFLDQFTLVTKVRSDSLAESIGIAPVLTPVIRPGRIIGDVVHMQPSVAVALQYGWTVSEQTFLSQSLAATPNITVADGIGVHPVLTASLAVKVLQGIGIAPSPLPSLIYTQTLLQGIGVSDAFRKFFGGALSDGIGQHEALADQFRASPVIADGIGLAPVLSSHFYIRVTMSDQIDMGAAETLQMIFAGDLGDGVGMDVGYAAPDGTFTTWAMNTRTAGVTEYQNYGFNSFAKLGDLYLGASSEGLYELLGDTDDGTDVIAHIKSGYAQWSGTHLGSLKAMYLAARGGGTYILRVISGDGKTYSYDVSANNMATTKIVVGKGLRARYFAFEMISGGQDFDLDTVEFVPIVAGRRV